MKINNVIYDININKKVIIIIISFKSNFSSRVYYEEEIFSKYYHYIQYK